MKSKAFFPITIRGKEYVVIQNGKELEITYDTDDEENVSEKEFDIVANYLIDEGFIK
jgi:hypothetical protein